MVWCRNVLIYFSPEGRKRALDRLLGATLPGGFVFVGYSESLRDLDELEAQRAGDAVVYVRRDERTVTESFKPETDKFRAGVCAQQAVDAIKTIANEQI